MIISVHKTCDFAFMFIQLQKRMQNVQVVKIRKFEIAIAIINKAFTKHFL